MKINNITINQKFGYKPIVKQQKINNNSQDVFFTSIKKITEKKYNLEKQYGFSEEIRQYFNQDDISFDEIKKIILKYFPDFQVIENPCKTKEGHLNSNFHNYCILNWMLVKFLADSKFFKV